MFGVLCPCGMFGFIAVFQLGFWLIWLFFIVAWILALVDAIKRNDADFGSKDGRLIWILILVFTNWVGALLYYILVYRKYGKAT